MESTAHPPVAVAASPSLVARLIAWSVAHRALVIGAAALLLIVGAGLGLTALKFDALPDITSNQVLVLTRAPGLSPEEVERLVTRPIEVALGGMPGLEEERSLSRYGISAVTAVFADDVAPYLARQVTQERLNTVALPAGVEPPALGPLTGGLGEIFHFALSSSVRTPTELLELATLKVAPLLRTSPGVVEVNTWGGQERVLEVRADALRLSQRGLTLRELGERLGDSVGSVAGASLRAGGSQALLRGLFRPSEPSELGQALVQRPSGSEPLRAVRVAEVAEVAEGAAPRLGAATRNGGGETVYVMAQMLRGANALNVLEGIHEHMVEVRTVLPPDVQIELIYDRGLLVKATLRTVGKNLLEGGLLVIVVLLLFLGNLRAGLLVASIIPLSMLGAVVGMVGFDLPGNLMSLGALDFGLLVDGAVVLVENLFHTLGKPGAGPSASGETLPAAISRVSQGVAKPVLFSVLIIVLVYVPVLTLGGVEGKMFRPMAATVVLALLTSLLLALTFVPAMASLLLRPQDLVHREPLAARLLERGYRPLLQAVVRRPLAVAVAGLAMLSIGGWLFARSGSEFVPQLDEGDLVIQTTRAADISLESATSQASQLERVLLQSVPEVLQVVSRVGSPAVATDIMGLEQADVFVALKPREMWRPGLSRDQLIRHIEQTLQQQAPGGEPSFTQPIQMRFNEILAGAVSDVAVSIYGDDLGELRRLAEAVAKQAAAERGAEDVRILAPPDVALLDVRPQPLQAAQAGLTVRDVLLAVQALRAGVPVAMTYRGALRIPIVLRLGPQAPSAFDVGQQLIPTATGGAVPLLQVAEVKLGRAPSLINRHNAERRLIVGFNVRGADLGSVVAGVQRRVAAGVKLEPGYRLRWGGQFETLNAAKQRLAILIPLLLLVILGVLWVTFGRLRPAVILFSHIPFACTGGMMALSLRGMAVSISAAIGFIALSGIALLNGVVLMSYLLAEQERGHSLADSAQRAALARLRPVMITALVAALGFVPMMLSHGIGAEVQRPLATVVVGGLLSSTLLTLLILPALYPYLGRGAPRR